jgi:hypothetical protein
MEIIEHGEIRSPVFRETPLPKAGDAKAPGKKSAENPAPEALGGTTAPAPA